MKKWKLFFTMAISAFLIGMSVCSCQMNDDDGYYFKFGIYRVGNSTVPVCYNLAGYKEE